MTTKKKNKAVAAKKSKIASVPKTKTSATKKKTLNKPKSVAASGTKKIMVKGNPPVAKKKKIIVRKKASAQQKRQGTESLIHGPDLHLVPVTGEIHPVRINEKRVFESNFNHKENTALHQEQQKVKAAMANRSKKVFFRPRQS